MSSRSRRAAEVTIDAPLTDCLDTILAVSRYPAWVRGYRSARVEEVDEVGRPAVAAYEVGGLGMRARYRLAYRYTQAPATVRFHQLDGDLTQKITGRYVLRESEGATHVRFEAEVELVTPVPGPLRRVAERIVVNAALNALADEVTRRRRSPSRG